MWAFSAQDFLLTVERLFQVELLFFEITYIYIRDESLSVSLILAWENGKRSLWSPENASLQPWLKVSELEMEEKMTAQTKAVISSAAEGGCLDTAVEMSASGSSHGWLLGQFTGLKDLSEVRSLTLGGTDRLVPVSVAFWIHCDLVCCVRLPKNFWNGFSCPHSWKVESSTLSLGWVCWSGHCCCAVKD